MGNTLERAAKKIDVVDIVRQGEKLMIPTNMSLKDVIDVCIRRMEYDKKQVQHERIYDVFPYDGAAALETVLKRKFGWAEGQVIETMFGDILPAFVTVAISHDQTRQVPWGKFGLHGINGYLFTGSSIKEGRFCFKLSATIVRNDEQVVLDIFEEVQRELEMNSLYRGKAISLQLYDDNEEALEIPEVKFMPTEDVDESMLIFSDTIASQINTNLFTPIERVYDCIDNGIPVKRGVLLGGPYGTGKTLVAKVASKKAVRHGLTFIYIRKASELAAAIRFGSQYRKPAVVIFCEDIDLETSGERDADMNELLNTMDGIDTKSMNLLVVLTTNHLDKVHRAMLRPGRLDAVIDVLPPDAAAAIRVVRAYGGESIEAHEDLSAVGDELNGTIPAVICEVVKRAKLSQLSLQKRGEKVAKLSGAALLDSARTMRTQLQLLKEPTAEQTDAEKLHDILVQGPINATADELRSVRRNVEALAVKAGVA